MLLLTTQITSCNKVIALAINKNSMLYRNSYVLSFINEEKDSYAQNGVVEKITTLNLVEKIITLI